AAIGAAHGEAQTPVDTDWREIAWLYAELIKLTPSPVVKLNHAVAVAMGEGLSRGLAMIDELGASCELDGYYLFHAARADILRRLGRDTEAAEAYRRAVSLTTNQVEQNYLNRRLREATQG